MNLRRGSSSRIVAALALAAAGVAGAFLLSDPSTSEAAQQSNFVGGAPSIVDSEEVNTLRLRFEAGSRSNWHSHTDGQLLMIEEGLGRTQERDGSVREVEPGEPWYTPAGVEHWHGAAPDEASVQLTIYSGEVDWMEPVSDEEYEAPVD